MGGFTSGKIGICFCSKRPKNFVNGVAADSEATDERAAEAIEPLEPQRDFVGTECL